VTAPTLVQHGTGMSQIPLAVPRALAADLPRGRLVLLDGTQPTLFMEDTAAVADMITAFLCDGVVPERPGGPVPGRGRPGQGRRTPSLHRHPVA